MNIKKFGIALIMLSSFSNSAFAVSDWSRWYDPLGFFENDMDHGQVEEGTHNNEEFVCDSRPDSVITETKEAELVDRGFCKYDVSTITSYKWDSDNLKCLPITKTDIGDYHSCIDPYEEQKKACAAKPDKINHATYSAETGKGTCSYDMVSTTTYSWSHGTKSCDSKTTTSKTDYYNCKNPVDTAKKECEMRHSFQSTETKLIRVGRDRYCKYTYNFINDYYWTGSSCAIDKREVGHTSECRDHPF